MKCARCGKDAPYFTDSYDPVRKENITMYLCEEHQIEFTYKMAAYVRGDGYDWCDDRGYAIKEDTPDEKILERIKETMDNSKPMPILTPTSECIEEIGKVLSWMYCRGIHMFGTDDGIKATIDRIRGREE